MQLTLQLESHSSIWAVGDILDFPEGKRAAKAKGQFAVLIPNLLVFLRDRNARLTKKYTPSPENIILTNGAVRLFSFVTSVPQHADRRRQFSNLQEGGIAYLPQLWGLTITPDWIIKHWLAKNLMVERFRRMMGSP
jgi:hypothetical protein